MRPSRIHAASKTSDRLHRVLKVLKSCGKRGATTRDIAHMADVLAVNSCVAELRTHGHAITCTFCGRGAGGSSIFRYRLEGAK